MRKIKLSVFLIEVNNATYTTKTTDHIKYIETTDKIKYNGVVR